MTHIRKVPVMKAVTASDRDADVAGLSQECYSCDAVGHDSLARRLAWCLKSRRSQPSV
jgi:hypothetical protein